MMVRILQKKTLV
ncbi:hypothetical protein OIU77_003374, partial [Salix suchowensis]